MKLHIYQQDKSNLIWVRDDEYTIDEMMESRLKFIGYGNYEDYEHIGLGFYRRKERAV